MNITSVLAPEQRRRGHSIAAAVAAVAALASACAPRPVAAPVATPRPVALVPVDTKVSWILRLEQERSLRVGAAVPAPTATGSGSVAEDGGIAVVLGPNSVTGRFNFARCRATGDWVAGEARGTWNAALH